MAEKLNEKRDFSKNPLTEKEALEELKQRFIMPFGLIELKNGFELLGIGLKDNHTVTSCIIHDDGTWEYVPYFRLPVDACDCGDDVADTAHIVKEAGGTVTKTYWDLEDNGEAYVDFTTPDDKPNEEILRKLGLNNVHTVDVSKALWQSVVVIADNEKKAVKLAKKMADSGDLYWDISMLCENDPCKAKIVRW